MNLVHKGAFLASLYMILFSNHHNFIMALPEILEHDAISRSYHRSGFSQRMDWGSRPGLLFIDVCKAYWTPSSPLDTSSNPESLAALHSMRRLLRAARESNVPIIWTRVEYGREDMRDAGLMFKKQSLLNIWQKGDTRGLDAWVDGLEPAGEDTIITKKMPSAFFGTTLAVELQLLDVDTLVICGVSTSGCVRATTLDAMQHGFRPMVSN